LSPLIRITAIRRHKQLGVRHDLLSAPLIDADQDNDPEKRSKGRFHVTSFSIPGRRDGGGGPRHCTPGLAAASQYRFFGKVQYLQARIKGYRPAKGVSPLFQREAAMQPFRLLFAEAFVSM
jgi:hypothetical protein